MSNTASALDALRKYSVIVADTANFDLLEKYKPQDATTNPTLVLQAVTVPKYAPLIAQAVAHARGAHPGGTAEAQLEEAILHLVVLVGVETLKIIPGRVSTEVDARYSFDEAKTVDYARRIIATYEHLGVSRSRVLVKIASTWEGTRAAQALEREGIRCNLTLLFSFAQAAACAEAGVTLISPFVGRILDWYRKNEPKADNYASAQADPGVLSVQRIYRYYKHHGYKTTVMAASFRSTGEIKELCGCDNMTISPAFLEELSKEPGDTITPKLTPTDACADPVKLQLDEKTFRWMLNEDAMGTEKLSEGIRLFSRDARKLEAILAPKLAAP